eukprot:350232-Chlamydomonas_euryale.AAC.6
MTSLSLSPTSRRAPVYGSGPPHCVRPPTSRTAVGSLPRRNLLFRPTPHSPTFPPSTSSLLPPLGRPNPGAPLRRR